MSEGHNPEAEKLTSYPLFDWLRFALSSIVVLGHAGFFFADFATGTLAVQIFFALSGWLIGGILLRSRPEELPKFFFNRATRIWIPYGLAILLLYGLSLIREGYSFFWLKYLIYDVTFTHQVFTVFPQAAREMPLEGSGNQFWSIAVEEQFYLLAPLFILFIPLGRNIYAWLIAATVSAVLDLNAAPIALGVSAAMLEQRGELISRSWPIAVVIAVASAAVIQMTGTRYLTAPILAVAIVAALARPGRRSKVALTAGGLSYPLYLNHWIGVFTVHFVMKRGLPMSHSTFVVLQYGLNIVLALALYFAVDLQIQRRRGQWYTRKIGLVLAATAYALVAVGLTFGWSIMETTNPPI